MSKDSIFDKKMEEYRVDDCTKLWIELGLNQVYRMMQEGKQQLNAGKFYSDGNLKSLWKDFLLATIASQKNADLHGEGSPLHLYLLEQRVGSLAAVNKEGHNSRSAIEAQSEWLNARELATMNQMRDQMSYYLQFGNSEHWLNNSPLKAVAMLKEGLNIYDYLCQKHPDYQRGLRFFRANDIHSPLLAVNNIIDQAEKGRMSKDRHPWILEGIRDNFQPMHDAVKTALRVLTVDLERIAEKERFIMAERLYAAARCAEILGDKSPQSYERICSFTRRGLQQIDDAQSINIIPHLISFLRTQLLFLQGKVQIDHGFIEGGIANLEECKTLSQQLMTCTWGDSGKPYLERLKVMAEGEINIYLDRANEELAKRQENSKS